MLTEQLILDMGIILAVAMLLGAILEKYNFPSILGYILAGMLIGPILGLVKSSELLELFSEVGVIMLLFYIGLELDPNKLREGGLAAIILGPAKIVINFVLGFLVGALFGFSTMESAFLGLIIMMSSTAVIGKYLMDRNEIHTLEASISITMLLLEDFIAVIILAILGSMIGSKAHLATVMLTSVAVVLVFMYVISEYSKYLIEFIEKFEYKRHISLYALGLVFLLSYIVSFFGLSPAIGAFFAGYLFSRVKQLENLEKELGTFREFFAAFFFVSVGMMFTVPSGIQPYLLIALLLIASLIGKYVGYGIIGRLTGLSPESSAKISALMIPIGEFSLIIASYAEKLGLPHSAEILDSAVLLGLLTAILLPYGMKTYSSFSKLLKRIPSTRLSIAGSIVHETWLRREPGETLMQFFRSLGVYIMAGFSVIYLFALASERIKTTILGYPTSEIFPWVAIVFLIPVLYGVVSKTRWLGRALVGIAGPSMFPELEEYHLRWIQTYLSDFLSGFVLMFTGIGLGAIAWIADPKYVLFPALVVIIGLIYAIKGYLVSLEEYEKIKRGIKVKKRMSWVGGRLR